MANIVRDGEMPQRKIISGDYEYVLYPDYNVQELATAGWGILRIDKSDANDEKYQWANGSKLKNNAADSLASLTYKNLL